jgi:DNA-binding MarR family transcriptional regulator
MSSRGPRMLPLIVTLLFAYPEQFQVRAHTDVVGDLSILSNNLTIDRSNAVRALQRLPENGFVLRRKDEADRRANLIRITSKGAKLAGKIGMIRRELAHQFFGELREAEATVVLDLRKPIPYAGVGFDQSLGEWQGNFGQRSGVDRAWDGGRWRSARAFWWWGPGSFCCHRRWWRSMGGSAIGHQSR